MVLNKKISDVLAAKGSKKAAMLLVSLGDEVAAEVMKLLAPEEVETMAYEISKIKEINENEREFIIEEFNQLLVGVESLSFGGVDYAKKVLENSMGLDRALEVIDKLSNVIQVKPFEFIKNVESNVLSNVLQKETPQAIALVLSHLEPEKASSVLAQMPEEIHSEIARRIAVMDSINPDVLKDLEQVLEKKFSFFNEDYSEIGGVKTTANILNMTERTLEKAILEDLENKDPELAEEIKKNMFVFEDIVSMDDRSIQKVLREVNNNDLSVALKATDEEVKEKIFSNMSSRAKKLLEEDIEYLGVVRSSDVHEAQQKILSIISRLEDEGEIIRSNKNMGSDRLIT